jgi:polysaccharide export outer membrane protein
LPCNRPGWNHHVAVRTAIALVAFTSSLLFAPGCKPQHPFVWASDVAASDVPVTEEKLRSGDRIAVTVTRMEELRAGQTFVVAADGTITLPLVGPLQVGGMTAKAAALSLNTRLNGIVVNPDARITVVTPRLPWISVVGEVNQPGRFQVDHGEGVMAALAQAGGLTEFADEDEIYVVRKYPSLTRIRFKYSDLVGGVGKSVEFSLRDGDVVVVE